MPLYPTNPISQPRALLLNADSVAYVLGSRAPEGGVLLITAVANSGTVATYTVSAWSGNIPVVGTKVTVSGTSKNAGGFNVANAAVTAVNLNAAGVGTITLALTGTALGTTADGGTMSFAPQTTGETVVAGSTIAVSPAFNQGRSQNSFFFEVLADSVAALPTGATFTPQQAMVNEDAAFMPITGAPVGTISGSAITAQGGNFVTDAPFVRIAITGVSGAGVAAVAITF